MTKKIIGFIKRETVLVIACLLAVISSFIVPPDKGYAGYIDFRTLGILFSLMTVMAGLRETGVFSVLAGYLLQRVKNMRQVMLILVFLCFFTSMFITNDVALITFVPFTFTVLSMAGEEEKRSLGVPITVFQTAAANLGSMLTPAGNPQNLYLYGKSGMTVSEFILLCLPYSLVSLLLVTAGVFIASRGKNKETALSFGEKNTVASPLKTAVYIILFIICLLAVARVIPWQAVLIITAISAAAADRKILLKVDYSLLFTFVGFFIFIGNMGRIPQISSFLAYMISGREVVTAVIASQAISNVPAALLLSGFTSDLKSLIIGVNIGGLGTLIASMASLISYKFAVADEESSKRRYLVYFTAVNLIFLAVMIFFHLLIS